MSKRRSNIAPKKKQSTQCCGYDFTLYDDISEKEVRDFLNSHCKKYCFQLEKGEASGKLHWQGRCSLKLKKREPEAIKLFQKAWQSFHLSRTSSENKNNMFYVMKDDTRIEGPFTESNEIFVPLDVQKMKTLRPWQQSLIEMLDIYDDRTVDIVYDKIGNKGKSSLTRYMMIYKDANILPLCNDHRDLLRMAYDVGPKKVYLIDMPRASNKSKLAQFFVGIEYIKSGYAFDDRNKFRQRLFNRPRICIFTNEKPDLSLLTKDMWKIWKIKDNHLVPYKDVDTEIEKCFETECDVSIESSEEDDIIFKKKNHSSNEDSENDN